MNLKIALLQLLPGGGLEEQLNTGKNACIMAREMGADITLFPEMWSDGYYLPQEEGALEELAIPADSEFVRTFSTLAKELQMAIGITFLEKNTPRPLNSIILFDRNGDEKLHYSKVHTCDFDEEMVLSSGEGFFVTDLDIGRGTVKVGSMICFDREFPESARILMLKGAEVILAPNACPMEINRLSALRTRAYENMVAVATCNYPKGKPDCNGHSTVFDGVAWLRDEPGVRDMCILEAPEEEGIYLAEIDMDLLRDYRKHEVMGNKFRHPETYKLLSKTTVDGKTRNTERLFLREMDMDDYDKVYALWMSCKNMGFNNIDDSKEGIERFLTRNPGTSFVAEEADRIVGVVLSGHDGRRGYIYHMSVAEDYRKQGVASKLLENSLAALKQEGINKVALLVFNRNEVGNAFWESQGFTVRDDVAYRNKALTEIVRIDT